ncbi:MAG: hypothetical protein PHX09_03290 [Clostridia bacterium]|nr:hypothetical protein [Clostridia bacterium]MDD4685936.1 hypothetical protein [Clostridia bacterium]
MKTIKKTMVMLLVCCCIFFLTGCGSDIKNEMIKNLSDVRYNLFEAKTDDLKVTLMCGLREEPYGYNGVSNPKCEFGVITVDFADMPEINEIAFTLIVDGVGHYGNVEKNPFGHNFMADIEKIVEDNSNVYLTIDGVESELLMICVSKSWSVQYEDALNIASEHFMEQAKQFIKNKKFKAECYLKIIYDENSEFDSYFWYFGIIGTDNNKLNLVIDVNSGEILTNNAG